MDTTHSRLKATSKKMADLIRKSGSNTQVRGVHDVMRAQAS